MLPASSSGGDGSNRPLVTLADTGPCESRRSGHRRDELLGQRPVVRTRPVDRRSTPIRQQEVAPALLEHPNVAVADGRLRPTDNGGCMPRLGDGVERDVTVDSVHDEGANAATNAVAWPAFDDRRIGPALSERGKNVVHLEPTPERVIDHARGVEGDSA